MYIYIYIYIYIDKVLWQATAIDVPGCPAMVRPAGRKKGR